MRRLILSRSCAPPVAHRRTGKAKTSIGSAPPHPDNFALERELGADGFEVFNLTKKPATQFLPPLCLGVISAPPLARPKRKSLICIKARSGGLA
jgi:hypothetical protein